MSNISLYEKELAFQADRRKAGVEFIKIISDLWYDKSIQLVLFRNQLIDKTLAKSSTYMVRWCFRWKTNQCFDSPVEIANAIVDLDLPPSRIDIGKLTYEYHFRR